MPSNSFFRECDLKIERFNTVKQTYVGNVNIGMLLFRLHSIERARIVLILHMVAINSSTIDMYGVFHFRSSETRAKEAVRR